MKNLRNPKITKIFNETSLAYANFKLKKIRSKKSWNIENSRPFKKVVKCKKIQGLRKFGRNFLLFEPELYSDSWSDLATYATVVQFRSD